MGASFARTSGGTAAEATGATAGGTSRGAGTTAAGLRIASVVEAVVFEMDAFEADAFVVAVSMLLAIHRWPARDPRTYHTASVIAHTARPVASNPFIDPKDGGAGAGGIACGNIWRSATARSASTGRFAEDIGVTGLSAGIESSASRQLLGS